MLHAMVIGLPMESPTEGHEMPDNEKPFKVRTIEGTQLSQHDNVEQAKAAAETANKKAADLGIATRYEVVEPAAV